MSVRIEDLLSLSPEGRLSGEGFACAFFGSLILLMPALLCAALLPNAFGDFLHNGVHSFHWSSLILTFTLGVYFLFDAVYLCAAAARRLNDAGKSRLMAPAVLIPAAGLLVAVFFMLLPSKGGMAAETSAPAEPVRTSAAPQVTQAAADQPDMGGLFDVLASGETTPEAIYETARLRMAGESLSVQLQVKTRQCTKLRGLLKKGKISEEDLKRWERRIMTLS